MCRTSKESPGEGSASGSRDKEGRAKGRGKGERGRGRGRGRGEDKTIQLHSEFALGPMGGGSSSGYLHFDFVSYHYFHSLIKEY